MADDEIGVHHLDVARRADLASRHFARPGGRKLKPPGEISLHAQPNLLHVEDDVGHILPDAGERRKFVKQTTDLDRSSGCALTRSTPTKPPPVAQTQPTATPPTQQGQQSG